LSAVIETERAGVACASAASPCANEKRETAREAALAIDLAGVDETELPLEVRVPGFSGAKPGEVTRLLRRAADGDERAWDALVGRFERLVWAVVRAHRLNGADAPDAVQATWVKLVEHLDSVQEPERLGAWLATTARRECLRILRKAQREIPASHAEEQLDTPQEDDFDGNLGDVGRADALWVAFQRLSPRGQALLRMLAAEPQPSYREISAALGIPIGSIGPTRGRALSQLRFEVERILAAEAAPLGAVS
jgi:RNA polymerase sigma factor (sigma-70 family)